MADEIRIPIEIDDSKGLAELSRFASKANKLIDDIAPGKGGKPGEVRIPVTVNAAGGIEGLNRLGVAAQRSNAQLSKVPQSSDRATSSLTDLGRVVQDAPYGFIGIANNLNPLLEGFQRLQKESGGTKGAIKSLLSSITGAGGLGLALSLITSAISFATIGFSSWTRGLGSAGAAAKKAASEQQIYNDALKDALSSTAQEVAKIQTLVEFIKLETTTRQQRVNAIKELQQIAPEYFKTLDAEKASVLSVVDAYDKYIGSIKRVIEGKIIEKQLLDVTEKRLKLEQLLNAPVESQIVRNGKLITVKNALYDVDNRSKEQQDELNNAKLLELQLAKRLAQLKPPPEVFKDPAKKRDTSGDDVISRAKEIAAFLKDAFVVKYEFSPLDDKATAIKKAQAFLDDVSNGRLKVRTDLFISPSPEPPKPVEIEKVKTILEQGFEKGIIVPIKFETDPGFINDDQVKLLDKFRDRFKEIGIQMFQLKGIDWMNMNAEKLEALLKAKTELVNIAGLVTQTLTPAFDSLFDAIVAGEDPLQSFFKSIQQSVVQLIKKLIAAAIQAAILSAIFPGGIGGSKGFGALFAKAAGFASGGIVSGPVLGLVGEGTGTSKRNPEIIAPLDQLKGFFAGMLNNVVSGVNAGRGVGTSGGGFTAPAFVELRASGNDLVGVFALTQAKQGRSF